ncbi:MAG: hypothetical protein HY721_29915 [Planctomycetes bacterium]|nr:hypothetical protein [Planctomycetota bacterium]
MLDGLETRAEARALLEFLKTEAGGEALIAGIARRLETTGVRVTDRCFGLVIPVEMEGHERLELYPWLEWRMGPVLIRSGSFALCRWPVSDPLLEPLSGREVSVSDCPGVTFRVLSTEAAVQRFRERGVSIDLDDLPRGRQPYTLVFERRREPVRWIPRWLKKLAGRSEG